jgi:hypothetical protein
MPKLIRKLIDNDTDTAAYVTVIIVVTMVFAGIQLTFREISAARIAEAAIAAGLVQDEHGHWVRPEGKE